MVFSLLARKESRNFVDDFLVSMNYEKEITFTFMRMQLHVGYKNFGMGIDSFAG